MHSFLKQSTATQTRVVGPFVDDIDFKSLETSLTINNTDVKLSANGGAAVNKNAGGGTHVANGMYALTFDATDTATVGELSVSISVAGALVVVAKFTVLEEAVYDALFGANAPGYLQPTTAGNKLDVTATGAAGIDWGNIENPSSIVDLSATDIQLCDTVTTNTDMRGTDNAALASTALSTATWTAARAGYLDNINGHTAQTGDSFVRLGAPAGVSVSADVAAVKADTGPILVDTNALNDTKIPDTISLANINIEVDQALLDYDAPTKAEMDSAFTEIKGATWSSVTDTLEAIRARGDAAWITATGFSTHTAADVRTEMDSNSTQLAAIFADTNELQTDWADAGRLDAILDNILVDTAEIGAAGAGLTAIPWNASWDVEVQSECNDALEAIHLDHLLAVADVDTPVDNSVVAKLAAKGAIADWSTFDNQTDSLQGIREEGDLSWGSGASNPNVLLTSEINTLGSQTSFTLVNGSDQDDAYNNQAIVLYDDSNFDFPSVRVVSDYTGSTKTITLDSAPDFTLGADDSVRIFVTAPGTSAPTAAQVADAVWDEAQADHVSVGSFGEIATEIADILVDTNDLQTNQGNWLTATGFSTHSAVDVRIEIDSNSTQLADIVADTNELQSDWTDTGRLDVILDAILVDTASLNDIKIPDTISLAAINAEVDTAIVTYGLDHLLFTSVANTDVADNSVIAKFASDGVTADFDDFDNTSMSLNALIVSQVAITSLLTDMSGATFNTATDSLEALANRLGLTVNDLGSGATIADNLGDMAGAAFATGTDSLEAIRNQGDAAWTTATSVTVSDKTGFELSATGADLITVSSTFAGAMASAVWNKDLSGFQIANSAGAKLKDVLTDTETTIPATLATLATSASITDGSLVVGTINDGAIGAAVVADIFSTTTIAEAYAGKDVDSTPAGILYLILQAVSDFTISTTTKTVRNFAGTSAATYTLDDDTNPTAIDRAT